MICTLLYCWGGVSQTESVKHMLELTSALILFQNFIFHSERHILILTLESMNGSYSEDP